MFRQIKNIIYVKRRILSSTEYFQLDIFDDKNVLKYISDKSNIKPITKNDDDKLVIDYFDKLFRIIDGWKDKYNNNAIDGIEWQLQITYKNGETKNYIGKNAFPSNFGYLDKIKDELIKCLGVK